MRAVVSFLNFLFQQLTARRPLQLARLSTTEHHRVTDKSRATAPATLTERRSALLAGIAFRSERSCPELKAHLQKKLVEHDPAIAAILATIREIVSPRRQCRCSRSANDPRGVRRQLTRKGNLALTGDAGILAPFGPLRGVPQVLPVPRPVDVPPRGFQRPLGVRVRG